MSTGDVYSASIKETLWHKMRSDLAKFVPDVALNQLLMCCACGRFLTQEFFDLEHLIPQQSLKRDPVAVQQNPDTPKNIRAGNLLLCKKPLRVKGVKVFNNGCNSWKGKHYDKAIAEFVSAKTLLPSAKITSAHIIGALCLGYLAMVAEFGYAVALMPSGLLMRRQFFSPHKYLADLPLRHHMVLGGTHPTQPENPIWTKPFSFTFADGCCHVGARNFAVNVPVTRDPRLPFAVHLPIVPEAYKVRPNFKTFFE